MLAPLPEVPILEDSHPDINNNRLPSVEVIHNTQQQYLSIAGDEDPAGFPSKFVFDNGRSVIRSAKGYVMEDGGNLWIPENANELKLRLLVSAHCGEAGHRGREATLARLRPVCFWSSMEADVASCIEDCLNCVDSKGGGKIPRPLGETTHGTKIGGCPHFGYLYIGNPDEPDDAVGENISTRECENMKYTLVMKEDITGSVILETSAVANATHAAQSLQRWCSTLGVPSVLVSDTASHFKNQLLRKLADGLGVNHQFTVANSHGQIAP